MKQIFKLIDKENSPEEIVNIITEGDHEFVEEMPLSYKCDCNRDRFEQGLRSLGNEELQKLIDENNDVEITCHFCKKKYNFKINEVKHFIK